MPPSCTVCPRKDRGRIDEMLLRGISTRSIAKQCEAPAPSAAAVLRHKAHLAEHVAKAHEATEVADAGRLLRKLQRLEERVEGLLNKAERSGQLGPAASLVRELRELLRIFGEISGELRSGRVGVQVNVGTKPLFSPETRQKLFLYVIVSCYLNDPAGFLEEVREAAAEDYVSYRCPDYPRPTRAEARAMLEARERVQPQIGPGPIETLEIEVEP